MNLLELERAILKKIGESPELQRDPEIIRDLKELEALKASNPIQFWEPYPKQAGFLAGREPVKAFFGGNGAGKTAVGVVDDLIQLVDRECLPRHLRGFKRWEPPFFLRVAAPKMAVVESVLLEKFRELCPKHQLVGGSFDKAYNKVNRKLLFANGSWVLFNTYDQDRDAWAGVELHRTHLDEEPEGEHGRGLYTESVARGRRFAPEAQIMFTMTPLFGLSWTYDEVWERRDTSDVACTVASMRDNPHIDAEATIRQLSHLSKEELAAVVDGKFVHFHGSVLQVTDHHLVDPPSPKDVQELDSLVGIDPGIRRGGVTFTGFDRDNVMLVYDEIYPENKTIPVIAADITIKEALWGLLTPERKAMTVSELKNVLKRDLASDVREMILERVGAIEGVRASSGEGVRYIIDPSARIRELTNAVTVASELAKYGIYANPGQNDRLAGALQLRARLDHGGLFVSRACENWLRESRRWLVAKDEVTEQQSAKVKGAGGTFATIGPDHLMDPTRYVAMERLWWVDDDDGASPRQQVWRPNFAPAVSSLPRARPESAPLGSMS